MLKVKIELSSQSWYAHAEKGGDRQTYWGAGYAIEDIITGKQSRFYIHPYDKKFISEDIALIRLLEMALNKLIRPCKIELIAPNNIYFLGGVKKVRNYNGNYSDIYDLLEKNGHVFSEVYTQQEKLEKDKIEKDNAINGIEEIIINDGDEIPHP